MKTILEVIKKKGEKKFTKLNDMKEFYEKVSERETQKNPIIYEVNFVSEDEISYATTKIMPGKIGKQFHMTKGHYHVKPTSEVYYHMEGQGNLILKKGNDRKVIAMKKGVFHYIPVGYGHRTVNTGKKPMIFLSIYQTDAGHDYDKVRKEGL